MREIAVYTSWNPPPAVDSDCSEGIGADQSFKDECDINVIMRRVEITGDFSPFLSSGRVGSYLDVTNAPADFMEAQNIVAEANSNFERLPVSLRNRFENSPARLIEFVSDPANASEAIALGLAKAGAEGTPAAPAVVPVAPAVTP